MNIFICASKHNHRHIPPINDQLESMGHIIALPNMFDDPFAELRLKDESRKNMSLSSNRYLGNKSKK